MIETLSVSLQSVVGILSDSILMNVPILLQNLVENVKLQAYKNLHELELLEEGSFIAPPMLLSSLQAEMSSSYSAGQQNVDTSVVDEGMHAVENYLLFSA